MKATSLNAAPTFEALPAMVQALFEEVKSLRKELETKGQIEPAQKPISTAELCQFLNVTEPTVIRWRKKGKIPFYTIGSAVRYNLQKVVDALEKSCKK